MAIDLGKQIGPLPLGAWIIVVGAGLGIMLYTRQTASPEPQEDTGSPEGVGEGGGGGWVDLDPPPRTDQEITDNAAWLRAATDFLIGLGYPADVVVAALNKAINGEQLTLQEGALWRQALIRYGLPPDGVLPGPPTPPIPGPNPGPQPSPTQPPRVVGMLVRSVTRVSVVLTWWGLRNWWNYDVYRLVDGKPRLVKHVSATSGNVPIVSTQIGGLSPNTAYQNFFVVAVNAAGKQGPWSNMVSFRTKR